MVRTNRLSGLRTKSYVYLQSNVTIGSYITKRSVLQYVTQHYDVITNRTTQHCNYITATLHYGTVPFFAAHHISIQHAIKLLLDRC